MCSRPLFSLSSLLIELRSLPLWVFSFQDPEIHAEDPRGLNLEMKPLRVRQQFRGPTRIEQISRSLDHRVPEALARDCGSDTSKNSMCPCENQKLQRVTIKSLQHLSKCQSFSNGNVSWADNCDSGQDF